MMRSEWKIFAMSRLVLRANRQPLSANRHS